MGATVGRRWTRACAALTLAAAAAGFGTCARAQSQPQSDLWTRSTMSGDWGGLRPWLDSKGVAFTFGYFNDFLANVGGGIKRGAVDIGSFQPQLDLDLQKLVGLDGGRVHVHGLVTHGPFFSVPYLGNIIGVSNIEAGPVARLYALWYEQSAFADRLNIRAGLMLADSQFLQSKTATNFINNGISWPMFLAGNLPAGGPAYPLPAPGVRAASRDSSHQHKAGGRIRQRLAEGVAVPAPEVAFDVGHLQVDAVGGHAQRLLQA